MLEGFLLPSSEIHRKADISNNSGRTKAVDLVLGAHKLGGSQPSPWLFGLLVFGGSFHFTH